MGGVVTDRHAGYVVILDHDLREDDAERILNALAMIKGVASVRPIQSDIALTIAEERIRQHTEQKLYDFTRNLFKGDA